MFSYLERLGTDIVSFISVGRFLQWSGDRVMYVCASVLGKMP